MALPFGPPQMQEKHNLVQNDMGYDCGALWGKKKTLGDTMGIC